MDGFYLEMHSSSMITNTCKTCEADFVKPHNPTRVYKYCSSKCMGLDKEKSIAHSNNMKGREAWNKGQKGLKPWMNLVGIMSSEPWNKGKKLTYRVWNKGLVNSRWIGEGNPNWRGGVTKLNDKVRKSIEYKQWRTAVFERDNFTCVECLDSSGGNLNADHIKQFAYYPELRFDVDNGRTLCVDCHKNTDTYLNAGRWRSV